MLKPTEACRNSKLNWLAASIYSSGIDANCSKEVWSIIRLLDVAVPEPGAGDEVGVSVASCVVVGDDVGTFVAVTVISIGVLVGFSSRVGAMGLVVVGVIGATTELTDVHADIITASKAS